MEHPIFTLRKWVQSAVKIEKIDNNTIGCGQEKIQLNQDSGISFKGIQFPVFSAYFAIITPQGRYTEYGDMCKEKNVPKLLYPDFKKLNDWLAGKIQTCPGMTEQQLAPQPVATKAPAAPIPEEVPVAKPAEVAAPAQEPIVRPPPQAVEYELLRTVDSSLISQQDFSWMITADDKLKNPTRPIVAPPEERSFKNFIIMVPQTTQCCINISNIDSFLVQNKFIDPVDCSTKTKSVKHRNSSTQKMLNFDVVADPTLLRAGDWNYVVAVFLSGLGWQIKKYTPSDPTQLFSRSLGVYVIKEGDNIPKDIENWRKKIFKIGRQTRHADANIVDGIWTEIEKNLEAVSQRVI